MYEDPDLIVLDKPAGLPCYPIQYDETETVANFLVAYNPLFQGIGEDLDPNATPFSRELLNWADSIFVMEGYMKTAILEEHCQLGDEEERMAKEKIVCLDIPDRFLRNAEDRLTLENMTLQEAIAYLDQHRGEVFGPKLFSKVLEGRLETLL